MGRRMRAFLEGPKIRKERQMEGAQLAHRLMTETGYDSDTINQVVKNFVETGRYQLPSALPEGVEGPLAQNQIRESERNRMRKPIYTRNEDDDTWEMAPEPVGGRDQVIMENRFRGQQGLPAGGVWRHNKVTGEYELIPGATSRDKFVSHGVKPDKPTPPRASGGGGTTRKTPEEEAAMKAYTVYLAAQKENKLTPDIEEQGVSAAQFLGIPLEEVTAEKKMGWMERAGRAVMPDKAGDKVYGSKVVSYQRPKFEQREELPPAAVQHLERAGGKAVVFANGQKWAYRNGKPVRLQ